MEKNWQEGINLWRKCENEGQEGLEDQAAECFLSAWEEDPSCIEALLGLHYFLPEQRYDLLAAIEPHAEKIASSEVHSYYQPLIWNPRKLESEADFRRAWAKELAWSGETEAAQKQLDLCPDDFITKLTSLDILFHSGDYEECLKELQSVEAPEEWDFEVRSLRALVLRRMDLLRPSFRLLQELSEEVEGLPQQLFLMYEQGLILNELGEEETAQSVFEEIYSRDVSYRNVAELLGREEDQWADIVDQLLHGAEATDPHIPDNS